MDDILQDDDSLDAPYFGSQMKQDQEDQTPNDNEVSSFSIHT
jgi:hypothetical protein